MQKIRFDPWVGKIPWRSKWQPTPVLLPGKSYGRRSLEGSSPWDLRVRHDWATSLTHFPLIKNLFCSPLLSAIRGLSSVYLRLLLFLLEILIPACASSSPGFLMMYSAYKLNKQGDNIQPCFTPFPILNQSIVPCQILSVASWPVYRFLRRQVRWSGIPISKNFPQFFVIHIVKGFSVVNEAEVDGFFFWNSLAFSMIQWLLAIWSLVSLPFLNPAGMSQSSWVPAEAYLEGFWA